LVFERDIELGPGRKSECQRVHSLIIGSGAAGLNAAVQLKLQGINDLLIVTEGLQMGTSINTGSDKQTYYKLGMVGDQPDSPQAVAEALFSGGSMHGDLALVEAAYSARAFFHLVNLGVPFPRDEYGQFVGYKTDHDPSQRATSIGPYTSREMCRRLIDRIRLLGIPILESRLATSLLTIGAGPERRAAGAIVLNQESGRLETFLAENIIFAVGGPGGLYQASVYPSAHTGAIGLALLAGVKARNLPEAQFGLASTRFRWNVSGSFMQVGPKFISTGPDGRSDPQEFLNEYYDSSVELLNDVFLKGYQWPFDAAKASGGSSLIDILVYIETVVRGRRVFLDYRADPTGFALEELSLEAREYLIKSGATGTTPLARLKVMNPAAIELYRNNDIDLASEPLEIAVCTQHNNGGLAADKWWQSENISGFYPIGEVNGTHGVTRPGGSALNSGQVGGFRAAEHIAHHAGKRAPDLETSRKAARDALAGLISWLDGGAKAKLGWEEALSELQARMSRTGAHLRSELDLTQAVAEAREQWCRVNAEGLAQRSPREAGPALTTRQLCFSQLVYLEACLAAVRSGQGSRGSALILGKGKAIHPRLGPKWSIVPEDIAFRRKVLETIAGPSGITSQWVDRRPLPQTEGWFETVWAEYQAGRIYEQ
jgi:succinate dehydrogenase/fumarate reductase flavoprotein subunit